MPGEEKVWLREKNCDPNADFHIKVNANYCDGMDDDRDHPDGNHRQPYDMGDAMEMTQTTQPLIGLSDRDLNGYKDKISGSSRYASTTSTLADERL